MKKKTTTAAKKSKARSKTRTVSAGRSTPIKATAAGSAKRGKSSAKPAKKSRKTMLGRLIDRII